VTEESRMAPCDVDWVRSKRAVESELMAFVGAAGLPLAIIQPTHVYGPHAYNGTLRPVHHMKYGKLVLPNSGEGICNTIYVDDVARALLLAATTNGALGEKFLISGPDSLTWREFYRAYETMLKIDGVALRPPDEMWRKGIPRTTTRLLHKAIKIKDVFPFKQLKARLSEQQSRALQDFAERGPGTRLYYPDRLSLRLYLTKAQVSYEKATRVLGYTPQFDFARGMNLTERYLRWANLL
jgi:nucleoside-diphosphate-sugar epimerase